MLRADKTMELWGHTCMIVVLDWANAQEKRYYRDRWYLQHAHYRTWLKFSHVK